MAATFDALARRIEVSGSGGRLDLVRLVRAGDALVFGADGLRAVDALEPPHGEMALRQRLEMIHEGEIDRRAAGGPERRRRLGDQFLADDEAESRSDLRQQPEQGGRGLVDDAPAGDIARGLGHRARQQAANGEIAGFRHIVAGSAAIQREHFETGQRGLGIAQILAFGAGDVGDRAQHDGGGHRQFERQAGEAQRPARRAGRDREDLVGAVAIADRPAIQAGEREFERDFHRRHGRVVNEPWPPFPGPGS